MSNPEVQYVRKRPEEFTRGQLTDLKALRMDHYRKALTSRVDHPTVTAGQFVYATTLKSWIDPNEGPRRSRRANPSVTVAVDTDEAKAVGFIYTADDASSHRTGLLGRAEEWAKLNVSNDRLLASRWLWIRELIAPTDERYVPHVLGAIATAAPRTGKDVRPVSCYPWAGETDLRLTLRSWGMREAGQPEVVHPIPGSRSVDIDQYRYTGETIQAVNRAIMQHQEAAEAIQQGLEDVALR